MQGLRCRELPVLCQISEEDIDRGEQSLKDKDEALGNASINSGWEEAVHAGDFTWHNKALSHWTPFEQHRIKLLRCTKAIAVACRTWHASSSMPRVLRETRWEPKHPCAMNELTQGIGT